jgi:hypothetical protein
MKNSSTVDDINNFNTPGSSGQISVYSSSPAKCLEIVNSSGTVETEPCTGASAEEWTATKDGSAASFKNKKYTTLCLNDKYTSDLLNAAKCPTSGTNQNQEFYPSQSV